MSLCFEWNCVLLLLFILFPNITGDSPISAPNSLIYGPGLKTNFTVPVRYFFIHLRDGSNNSFAGEKKLLDVQVTGLVEKCHLWHQVLKIKPGMFATRFRLFEICNGLRIDVAYNEKPLADSPYFIEGKILPEKCYCPKPMSHWLSTLACPSGYHQINDDLSLFSKINMKDVLLDALKRFDHPGAYSICHYMVVMNKVYRNCYGQYVGFSMFMDEILLSLTRKTYLPDVEMIVNLGDWPLEQREASQNPIPIFSWCGSNSTRDIVMPTYDITESTLEMMGRVMLDIFSVMDHSGPAWHKKKTMAFWRGRDSRQERLDLIKIARKNPEKINASLTNFFFYRKDEEEYGPKTEYIPFFNFFMYKYQITIDGTVAAYRMPYLLGGRSLVLKQQSHFYEHFYRELKPMVHYVPFERDLSNLVDTIDWAVKNDKIAMDIAEQAQEFVLEHLMPKDILCYYAVLLNEYSKRLLKKPEVLKDMEHVKQPDGSNCDCNIHQKVQSEKLEL